MLWRIIDAGIANRPAIIVPEWSGPKHQAIECGGKHQEPIGPVLPIAIKRHPDVMAAQYAVATSAQNGAQKQSAERDAHASLALQAARVDFPAAELDGVGNRSGAEHHTALRSAALDVFDTQDRTFDDMLRERPIAAGRDQTCERGGCSAA